MLAAAVIHKIPHFYVAKTYDIGHLLANIDNTEYKTTNILVK